MTKTDETKLLEEALHHRQITNGEYGCEEITIGFKGKGKGDEIVDYMTMDSRDVFRCYEIKVTLSDLKTDNALSFYGDYNYLVISESLYLRNPVWDNHIPPYAGILCGQNLRVIRQAKKKTVSDETREMLKSSLLRSVYRKYENYRDVEALNASRQNERDMQAVIDEYQAKSDSLDRLVWTYHDYEHYYAANHQMASFDLESDDRRQRKEYELRKAGKMTWIQTDSAYECPACGNRSEMKTAYCPYCGSDLRIMGEHE